MKKNYILITALLASNLIFAQWDDFNWDTIKFENPYQYIEIGSTPDNIWEIGEPNKLFLDSAFSIPKAIITDANDFYPTNNNSFFDLYIGNYNIDWFPDDIFIEINHKFDTDTLKDGGYITVSYDMGETWTNIIDDVPTWTEITPNESNLGLGFIENLYTSQDTLYNGEKGFSGKSNGWLTTRFSWYSIPSKSPEYTGDTLIIRFNFISDDIETNKEGWLIDNIRLYSKDLGGGILNKKTSSFIIYPNPSNDFIVIKGVSSKIENIEIYNLSGNMIKQCKYQGMETKISTKDLNRGLYLVRIGKEIRKLIIE